MPLIHTKNINKYFHDGFEYHALSDINLEVEKGGITAIVGKSGCGKSTLLYTLSTLDTKYDGELYIDNVLLTGKPDDFLSSFRNKNIGFVFQSHYLLSELSVLKNVSIPFMQQGNVTWKEADSKAYELLKSVGLEKHTHKNIIQLSGGQQQRVSIARALINSPQIVMADEPTGNLDSRNSEMVFELFKEIVNSYKTTIIVVTHDLEFANNCDRIIKMEDGKIIA